MDFTTFYVAIEKHNCGYDGTMFRILVKRLPVTGQNSHNVPTPSTYLIGSKFIFLHKTNQKVYHRISQNQLLNHGDELTAILETAERSIMITYYILHLKVNYLGNCSSDSIKTSVTFTEDKYHWHWAVLEGQLAWSSKLISIGHPSSLTISTKRMKWSSSLQEECDVEIMTHMDQQRFSNQKYQVAHDHVGRIPEYMCPSDFR